jgi:hypothetical protein
MKQLQRSARAQVLVPLLAIALGACGGSSGSPDGAAPHEVGQLLENEHGGLFFVDEHQEGQARALRLAASAWARLVDVHDVDAAGTPSVEPLMRDVPVRPDLASDPRDFALESGSLGRTRLVVLHPRGTAAFEAALRDAAQDLPVLPPRGDGGTSSGPFPFVARNAAIVLRFDDLLEAGADARAGLIESVRVLVGHGTRMPFRARVFFAASHGALRAGVFHPTRVVVDPTISADEQDGGDPLALNPVGLPASLTTTALPNVSVRLATRTDPGSGHFHVLTNLRGRGLDPTGNGPTDASVPTLDVVRALRSGNRTDPNNGFLRDDQAPSVVGRWPTVVHAAAPDPLDAGAFVLTVAFTTTCTKALTAGELLETAAGFLVVTAASAEPDVDGVITAVSVRATTRETPRADQLLGLAHLWTALDSGSSAEPACFVEVVGRSTQDPAAPMPPNARLRLRFSEPMEPASFDALDTLRLFAGPAPTATSTVVATARGSSEATAFELLPLVPLAHAAGGAELYTLELVGGAAGGTDLAGNALATELPPLELALDPAAPAADTGGVSLRFADGDEYGLAGAPDGGADLRGLFTYDTTRGALLPRPVQRHSTPIDGSSGITTGMLQLSVAIREPFLALGSRLQTLWRYVDAGWRVEDELRYDLDVEGVAWKPFTEQVVADFFQDFELALGHAVQLPDEGLLSPGVLAAPGSGLRDAPASFDDNVLEPGGARAVNVRDNGYRVSPTALFQSPSGSRFLPLPVTRNLPGGPFVWRDTSLQGRGGANGLGVPLFIEETRDPSIEAGSVAAAGLVPTFGLPLLMEVRAFPDTGVLGLNGFQVAVAQPGQLFPNFRLHASGGFDLGNRAVTVHPELTPVPSGGYDPFSTPPGQPTASAAPVIYFGQLDTVSRLSRVHTVWFDSGSEDADWLAPLVTPARDVQPAGTDVVLEFRGARGFVATAGAELDATRLDPYGEPDEGLVLYPDGDRGWTREIDAVDGLRWLQVRITFVNDVDSGLAPTLDSLAFAFVRR